MKICCKIDDGLVKLNKAYLTASKKIKGQNNLLLPWYDAFVGWCTKEHIFYSRDARKGESKESWRKFEKELTLATFVENVDTYVDKTVTKHLNECRSACNEVITDILSMKKPTCAGSIDK